MKEQDKAKKQLINGSIGLCQETAGFENSDTERHKEMLDHPKASGHAENIVDRVRGPLTMLETDLAVGLAYCSTPKQWKQTEGR